MPHRRLAILIAGMMFGTCVTALGSLAAQRDIVSFKTTDAPSATGSSGTDVATSNETIAWQRNFVTAQQTAKSNQIIFVDVYTHWCSWCRYMDSKVYVDPSVRQFAAQNVFVKLDAEDGKDGEQFARNVGIHAYPTLLVYRSDGKLIGQWNGAFRSASDMMKWLNKLSSRK